MDFEELIERVSKELGFTAIMPASMLYKILKEAHACLSDPNIDIETRNKRLRKFELEYLKFISSENGVQILIRNHDRIAQVKIFKNDSGILMEPLINSNLLDRPLVTDQTPNVKEKVDLLHQYHKPIVCFLGGVRNDESAEKTINACSKIVGKLVDQYTHIGVLTAGYKGDSEALYPITRAAFDATKIKKHKEFTTSLVVIPHAGESISHVKTHAKDTYGDSWGDDTPALIGMGDVFIVFAPYGLITELEITTALKNNKPVVIVNSNQNDDEIVMTEDTLIRKNNGTEKTEKKNHPFIGYNQTITSYKSPEAAVAALITTLHAQNKFSNEAISPNTKTNRLTHSSSLASVLSTQYIFSKKQWVMPQNPEDFSSQFKHSGSLIMFDIPGNKNNNPVDDPMAIDGENNNNNTDKLTIANVSQELHKNKQKRDSKNTPMQTRSKTLKAATETNEKSLHTTQNKAIEKKKNNTKKKK